ncbi:MAG: type II/IV secretion system ATPase subunit [Euryarchaeota archaeon]|nr:type II/IV secretion system ATPase subunit [Euryarchaeota archaeon]
MASLVKKRPRRVMVSKSATIDEMEIHTKESEQAPTVIPRILDPKVEEIEIRPIREPYSYVRITLNRETNAYLYEVIEPQLNETETEILGFLKDTVNKTLDYTLDEASKKDKEEYLKKSIDSLLLSRGIKLSEVSKERIMYYLIRDFVGYGLIDVMMTDPQIEDVSCDGTRVPIYIFHRKYQSMRSNLIFKNDDEANSFIIGLAQKCGKTISVADPLLDATVPDGSRLQATLAREVTTRGTSFTIRRFRDNPFTPCDMMKMKTMSVDIVAYLWLAIEHGESMFVVGGTASGKTTTLNALFLFIPPQSKIVSIEDTREINLPHENWIAGLTRQSGGGKGGVKTVSDIDMFELMRAAMRQRPQYLIVGEVRGKEAYTLFQAMATGKTVYSTIHADSVRSMVHRLENPPIELPRLLLSSLNLVLLQGQVKVGRQMTRRVKGLIEIVGIEPETNELITNTVFSWSPATDVFTYNGHSFLFEKIMSAKNLTNDQMKEEYQKRIDVLNYMVKTNVKNHTEFAKVITGYYRDPEKVINNARQVLYGTQIPAPAEPLIQGAGGAGGPPPPRIVQPPAI